MKPWAKRVMVGCLALAVMAGVWIGFRRAGFAWAGVLVELRRVTVLRLMMGVGWIYMGLWMRLVRWSILCAGAGRARVRAGSLLGPMCMGFTAVALFGRLADLARPFLIARRIGRTLSSQVAVYTLERMFDLGAAATVFSGALALMPAGMEHRERFVRVGMGSLLATLVLAVFAMGVRSRGEWGAGRMGRALGGIAPRLARAVEERILGFQEGLRGLRTWGAIGGVTVLSVGMWGLIGVVYWQTLRAFAGSPELARVGFSRAMLLMAVSLGGSLVQLPVVGWFTQIAVLAVAIHTIYGARVETATACGVALLVTTSLCILPAGLYFAWRDGVSLRAVVEESGAEVVAE